MANSNKPRMPGGMKRLLDNKLFECPVCFGIPEAEIYQCKNGHSTCGPCAGSVDQCPQCREPWGKNGKVRNLSMEAVIAEMEVSCKNRKYGCRVTMPRKELAAHVENRCKFTPINLCKILKYTTCDFLSTPNGDIYDHVVELHKVQIVELRKCKKGVFSCRISLTLAHLDSIKENHIKLVAVEYKDSQLETLVCLYNNVEQGDFSVFCLYLGHDEQPPKWDVAIELRAGQKNIVWSWSGPSIGYQKAKDALRAPPFKISIPYLEEVLGKDEELALQITFS